MSDPEKGKEGTEAELQAAIRAGTQAGIDAAQTEFKRLEALARSMGVEAAEGTLADPRKNPFRSVQLHALYAVLASAAFVAWRGAPGTFQDYLTFLGPIAVAWFGAKRDQRSEQIRSHQAGQGGGG